MIIPQLPSSNIKTRFRSKSTKELSSILKKTPSIFNNSNDNTTKNIRIRSNSTQSLGSKKNVRFSTNLIAIKKFDKFAEPITISNETSPDLSPLLIPLDMTSNNNNDNDDDSCWFHDLNLVPRLIDIENNFNEFHFNNKKNKLFSLDDEDYNYDNDEDLNYYFNEAGTLRNDNNNNSNPTSPTKSCTDDPLLQLQSNQNLKWELLSTNIINSNLILTNDFIKHFMHNQNIKIQSLKINNENKLAGYLIVNNLSFEKYIEIKFTFNNWQNIHYVNASFNKIISPNYDQFKFVIDINSFKFFLNLKNLLINDILNIELCCRYDVKHETYYDNNNYNNYKMVLKRPMKKQNEIIPNKNDILNISNVQDKITASASKADSLRRVSSMNPVSRHHTRTFSADTDFFNTSPLKNIYYNKKISIPSTTTTTTSTTGTNVVVPTASRIITSASTPHLNEKNVLSFNSDLSSISSSSISSAASSTSTDSSSLYSFQTENDTTPIIIKPLPTNILQLHDKNSINDDQPLAERRTRRRESSPPDVSPLEKTSIQDSILNTATTPGIECINSYLSPSLADIKDQLYLSPSKGPYETKNVFNDNNTITSYSESVATDATLIKKVSRKNKEESIIDPLDNGSDNISNKKTKNKHSTSTPSLDSDYKSLLDSCCFYTPTALSPNESSPNKFSFMSSIAD
ncbi:similar to Saccharomyces cerevisiae YOR178C GAC1 Regulatory subunit for Glc7p type-1 protein phosphatase (PP1) [Maudiozyma barnettii]|uniref:Similar to Saccharomyces cerevisiae YOR178C GAC1 Regulatory subunit for Glc7p type-1 protein phosphatase (PP1) n=1 Tax=Maudiozyma barnettii TaxID=61262 RepID=A0A8H2VEX6_9SACH|nr:protein phosphatase regulator GAC1 [Kazachstania barnettii]CAB4254344.1 similar to Saccharomyces cerevisiae YOR178C GAC1 Regulatory subunit for Glc7p type-1 protein phosphatase (PP1) [Kazachstania barnettii]CAD1782199.1 similar to Saccharomyces cerevisiae YOR178C GAC1 Regulatory subunit for Glc7p type-1 protein phosphatase (PP1) [Kazachstania barnettii]